MRCNERKQKQLSISNQHIRVPRRRAFNFTQVPFQCVLVMPSNSVINAEFFKKTCTQKYWFSKKICSQAGFKPTTWMQVSCSTHWAIWLWFSMECCLSFLHFFVCRTQPDHRINSRWQEDDGFMMLSSWYVDVDGSRRVNGVTDRETDGRLFSFIYIDFLYIVLPYYMITKRHRPMLLLDKRGHYSIVLCKAIITHHFNNSLFTTVHMVLCIIISIDVTAQNLLIASPTTETSNHSTIIIQN